MHKPNRLSTTRSKVYSKLSVRVHLHLFNNKTIWIGIPVCTVAIPILQTKDGTSGKIKDFLFDEESWVIRYIDADFGGLFKNRRILIPTALLGEPDWEKKHFP
ncbi:MAG: PRC-barrel domain-containing protein, partial [Bacteroidales bacterium]